MALTGRIPFEVGNIEVTGVTNVSAVHNVPTNVKKFMNGDTDLVFGIDDYSITVTCAMMSDKQAIIELINAAKANDPDGYFSCSYKYGSHYYTATKCGLQNITGTASTDDASLSLTIVAGKRIRAA
jgi:hypothetical protein